MRNSTLLMIATLSLFCSSVGLTQAAGADSGIISLGNVGSWTLAVDKTDGNQCFIGTIFNGGYALRLGFNPRGSENPAYIAVASSNWTSLEAGKDYDIAIQFDHNPVWKATAKGVVFGDNENLVALAVGVSNVDFFEEFSRKLGIRVFYEGKQIANLSLRGSAKAIASLVSCQQAVDKYVGAQPNDPFSNNAPKSNPAPKNAQDPFAL